MIVDAAFAVVRRSGVDDINVRKVANEIGCSTQPVMYHFKTVEDLKAEIYDLATEYYENYLVGENKEEQPALTELCRRYLKFSKEEGNLFRFIFQSGRYKGDHFEKMFGCSRDAVVDNIVKNDGFAKEQASELAASMFTAVHGYASIAANNNAEFNEKAADDIINGIYNAFKAAYVKAGKAKK